MLMSMGVRHAFMDHIIDQLINYARLNFTKKLELRNYLDQDEKLASIAIGVNILGEELENKVLELQKLNLELEKNNLFVKKVTSSVPESIFVYNRLERKITYSNKSGDDIAALPCIKSLKECKDSCEGCSVASLFDPLTREAVQKQQVDEICIREEGAQDRWYRASITPFERDDAGLSVSELITLTDISALKLNEIELIRKEKKISQSLNEKQLLLQEIHHRVKNNLQIISGLIELQVNRIDSKEAILQLKQTKNRIKSIALIHETLYQSVDISKIDMSKYAMMLSRSLSDLFYDKNKEIELIQDIDKDVLFPIDKAIPMGLLLNEAISNCYKHAFKDRNEGKIWVLLKSDGKNMQLIVRDNGVGNKRISDAEATGTLGIKLIHLFAKQLNISINMMNRNGFIMKINIPVTI